MMSRLNLVINGLFDLLMRPFMVQSAWPGLIAASLVASIVLVILFGFTWFCATSEPKAKSIRLFFWRMTPGLCFCTPARQKIESVLSFQ